MGKYSNYENHLIKGSKKGRHNSFIDLSFVYLKNLFILVLELVPIEKEIIRICSEVLLITWRNINQIENADELEKLINKIATIRSKDFLIKNDVELLDETKILDLSEKLNISFSQLEKEILKLPSSERVLLILCDRCGYSVSDVGKVCSKMEEENTAELLQRARQKIISKFPSEKFAEYDKNTSGKTDKNSNIDDTSSEEYLEYSKKLLESLFKQIEPNHQIIDNLKSFIFDEMEKKISISKENILQTENLLKDDRKTEKKLSSTSKTIISSNKKFLTKKVKVFFSITGILIISLLLLFLIFNKPKAWQIADNYTQTTLNGTIPDSEFLKNGDILTTKDKITTTITFPGLASIKISNNSELALTKLEAKENIFDLKHGNIKFISEITSPQSFSENEINYTINTPNSTIKTDNATFSCSVENNNTTSISVLDGVITLKEKSSDKTGYCCHNYNLKYQNSYSLILPFHKNSSKEFINAIEQISKSPADNNAFSFILENAKDDDALTLWHLISLTDIQKRKMVVKKIDELVLTEFSKELENNKVLSEETKQYLLELIINDVIE